MMCIANYDWSYCTVLRYSTVWYRTVCQSIQSRKSPTPINSNNNGASSFASPHATMMFLLQMNRKQWEWCCGYRGAWDGPFFSAEKWTEAAAEGHFEIWPTTYWSQCCIVGGAASGRFSHEILRKIDKAPTQYLSLLPLCIVYNDRILPSACT